MKEYRLKNFWKTTKIFSERIFSVGRGVFAGRRTGGAFGYSFGQSGRQNRAVFGLIGRGDAEAQREAVSAYGEYFRNELKNAENENKSKGNLNRKLGFLLGVFLSVLVL